MVSTGEPAEKDEPGNECLVHSKEYVITWEDDHIAIDNDAATKNSS